MGAQLDARRRNLARAGRNYTLRRQTQTSPATYSSVTVLGFRRAYRPDQIAGSIMQGDWTLEILNDEIVENSWPGPPISGDEVQDSTTATYAVEGAEAIYEATTLIGYRLHIRGGA